MSFATLSHDEFQDIANQFAEFTAKHHLGWQLEGVDSADPYLVYRQILHRTTEGDDEGLNEDIGQEDGYDQATVASPKATDAVDMEYHVVYSESYQVPVLYFNAFHSDGKLLKLEDIWSNVPGLHQQRINHDKWSMITQQEHPILGRPFFQLHPCNTATLMKQALAGAQSSGNYIVTWLSSVGPVVGLHLPLMFSKLCEKG